jgi:hypothetical protein
MPEQLSQETYEPPTIVEVGEFSEDTLGCSGGGIDVITDWCIA